MTKLFKKLAVGPSRFMAIEGKQSCLVK